MTTKNLGGRQFIEIDWDKVDKLIQYQCTCEEVAGELGISTDTLVRRIKEKDDGSYAGYAEYASSKKSSGKARLRITQFTQALKGNTTLLAKLGEVYLGQDKKNLELPPPNDEALEKENFLINELKKSQDQILSLTEQLNALKSQTNPIVQRSNEEVQHLGRLDESGKDIHIDPEVRIST